MSVGAGSAAVSVWRRRPSVCFDGGASDFSFRGSAQREIAHNPAYEARVDPCLSDVGYARLATVAFKAALGVVV